MGLRGEVRTNKAIKYIILRRTAGWSTRAFQSALPSQILPRPFRRGTRHAGLNTKLLLKRGSAYAFRREFLSRCFAARLFHLSFLSSPALFFPSFLPSFHVRSFVRTLGARTPPVSCVRRFPLLANPRPPRSLGWRSRFCRRVPICVERATMFWCVGLGPETPPSPVLVSKRERDTINMAGR